MKKQNVKAVKIFIYGILIVFLACLCYFDGERVQTLKLKIKLKWGAPEQKEYVLNQFMDRHPRVLIPTVIEAILDDTSLPMHGDTGWGKVYHQAATAISNYARLIDGKTQFERGRDEYSFGRDVGRASLERRKEVYNNWKKWWKINKNYKIHNRRRLH